MSRYSITLYLLVITLSVFSQAKNPYMPRFHTQSAEANKIA
jgi:hypothetical protein